MSTTTLFQCNRCNHSSTEFSDFSRYEVEGLSIHLRGHLCRGCVKKLAQFFRGDKDILERVERAVAVAVSTKIGVAYDEGGAAALSAIRSLKDTLQ